ncbi:MAG: methylamine utilization protein [Burkholderiales bacterium]|uniref:methylamine utilization protein n=1 Tax=Inhella sp. TaxID=1921806 RepID=UPI001ACDBDBD|nr:methylamine utilization protein [Burkholderiales bacterium]
MRVSLSSLLLAAALASALPVQSQSAGGLTVTVLDRQGAPLAGAVVALEQAGLPRQAKPGTEAEMAQRDRQFSPQVLAVQVGTRVQFPNLDKVRHHVYSYSRPKTFELKLYLGEAAPPVVFDKPGVVQLGCNIHDQMSAHIVVVATPQFGVSDARGRVSLPRVAGAGTLRLWHASLGETLLSEPMGNAAEQTLRLR